MSNEFCSLSNQSKNVFVIVWFHKHSPKRTSRTPKKKTDYSVARRQKILETPNLETAHYLFDDFVDERRAKYPDAYFAFIEASSSIHTEIIIDEGEDDLPNVWITAKKRLKPNVKTPFAELRLPF